MYPANGYGFGFCDKELFKSALQQPIIDYILTGNVTYPLAHNWDACRSNPPGHLNSMSRDCLHVCDGSRPNEYGLCIDGYEFSSEPIAIHGSNTKYCATKCVPQENYTKFDYQVTSFDKKINSLGYCESYLFSGD